MITPERRRADILSASGAGWKPALVCPAGSAPPSHVNHPERITVPEIDEEPNIALRRVMIERFELELFVKESGAKIINQDKDHQTGHDRILYRRQVLPDEPIVMVSVTNSTAEPDGTYKQYFIRVPPNIRTAQEAVAWTFGLAAEEYRPSQQT